MDTHFDHVDAAETRSAEARHGRAWGKLTVRLAIMALLLAVVFGALYAYEQYRSHAIAAYFAGNKPPPLPVAAATATTMVMPRDLAGIGSLSAVHQVLVAPQVAGGVTQIFFDSGAIVRSGDPLVQLNDEPDRGDLANFQVQARLAQGNLGRANILAAHQFETQANVDTLKAQYDQANASIAKTEAIIAEKLVRAPFAGVLGIRQVDLGQYVNAGTTLVTLTDLDTLYVNFTLPEDMRGQLKTGQTVAITVDAYPDRSFDATLATIEPQVDPDTRTIKLQGLLANPEHLLMPGMFAHVRVALPDQPNVVAVPATAVDYTLYGDSVFVIVKDSSASDGTPAYRAKRSFVTTGAHFGDKVAVLTGLAPGDRIVVSGQLKLFDGAPVLPAADTLVAPPSVPVN